MEDERGPGLDFTLCFVCGSRPRGAAAFLLCLVILLLKCLNVRRFPPPSSRTYLLRYIGAETREEGGTRCQRALAAEWDRGAEKIGQQEVAETASGCPKRWCWSKRRTGGTEDSLPCSWDEEGWLPSERERRSRPVRLEAEACCHPPCLGRSRERGTRCRLPSTGGATAVRQEADEHRAVHQRGPVPSHGTASEPLSWLRTERQCVREPDRDFFFLLSPLSRLCHSSSFRLLSLASSVLTPRYAAAALTGSPQERGEGGSRAQSREYPPACEGRWGYVTSGVGPRAVGTERGRWSE